jgi:deoxyribodipyrimidine photo-lyase
VTGGALVWFRRDLRDYDNAALAAALAQRGPVHCAFVFDTEILDRVGRPADPRITFIHDSLVELREALERRGGGLHVLHGRARDELPRLARELDVGVVHANRDYEPAAIDRDAEVAARLEAAGMAMRTHKDQVLFEAHEVTTTSGHAYSVFTPYKRAWLARLDERAMASRDGAAPRGRLVPAERALPTVESIGFVRTTPALPAGMSGGAVLWEAFLDRIGRYAQTRDYPAAGATSGLSAHLRFGTVSIRELVRAAARRQDEGARKWLGELAWRDFYFAILATRPDVVERSFHREFDSIAWVDDEAAWQAWREGRTGYPLVDAAMRELAAQGTMHNRLRMVVASFLVKDLGIDWRRGERYFAQRLLDYDLAANNGNWQWCASTGCDAQPWFRVFNPVTQSRDFDPHGDYIRRWVPELAQVQGDSVHAPWDMAPLEQRLAGCIVGRDYPAPIVDHDVARRAALARYETAARKSAPPAATLQ